MRYEVEVRGKRYEVEVEEIAPDLFSISIGGKKAKLSVTEIPSAREVKPTEVKESVEERAEGIVEIAKVEGEGTPITVAMAGTITKILKREGEEVEEGEDILILEAMKMENSISSPKRGKISKIIVKPGDKVSAGDVVAFVM
jgi:biotin carboxyl carrier protein